MSLGLTLLLIVAIGYFSNWLNGRFFNYRITHALYYIGAFVHESSHALLCLLTGAHIEEFAVFSEQPHVTHTKSHIPLLGGLLISSAPVFGGLAFLWLIDKFVLGGHVALITPAADWRSILLAPLSMLASLKLTLWQSWVFLLLLVNVGAMIGPSLQDIKNIWLVFILLFFVSIPSVNALCLLALSLIIANVYIQCAAAFVMFCLKKAFHRE